MSDTSELPDDINQARKSLLGGIIWFCLHNKLVILLVVLATLTWGAME